MINFNGVEPPPRAVKLSGNENRKEGVYGPPTSNEVN